MGTPMRQAVGAYLEHLRVHSPDKPRTWQRYQAALGHFLRLCGQRRFVEAVTRSDIEAYKQARLFDPAADGMPCGLGPGAEPLDPCLLILPDALAELVGFCL